MEKKTHWKSMHNYDYLGAYSLDGKDEMVLTIKKVTQEDVKGASGRSESCMVIYFEEENKPMICNKTNAKAINKLYDTPYLEDWVGKAIVLGAEKVSAFGETTEALRVKPYKPKVKIDTKPIVAKINTATTLDELKTIWTALSKNEQNNTEVITAKDNKKNELTN